MKVKLEILNNHIFDYSHPVAVFKTLDSQGNPEEVIMLIYSSRRYFYSDFPLNFRFLNSTTITYEQAELGLEDIPNESVHEHWDRILKNVCKMFEDNLYSQIKESSKLIS